MKKIAILYKKYKEIWNYLIVGVLTTVVSLVVYYSCVYTVFNPEKAVELQLANIISWLVAVTFAYVTNRRYVFESASENKFKEAMTFFVTRIATLIIDMVSMFTMVTMMGISDKIAKLIVQIVITISNYILSKFIVFRRNK